MACRDEEKEEMNILISGPLAETARSAGLNTRHVCTEIYIQSCLDAGAVDTGAQEPAWAPPPLPTDGWGFPRNPCKL